MVDRNSHHGLISFVRNIRHKTRFIARINVNHGNKTITQEVKNLIRRKHREHLNVVDILIKYFGAITKLWFLNERRKSFQD